MKAGHSSDALRNDPLRLRLQARTTSVLVETTSPRVLEAVALMFPELLDGRRGQTSRTERPQLNVTAQPDGTFTVVENGTPWGHGMAWSELVARVEHRIAEWILRAFPDRLPLHAGGARIGAGAVLLLGPSGSGKSSVTTALLLQGCRIFGDDVVLLDTAGQVESFPRRPKVDASQAVRLGLDPTATVLWHEGADECWIDTTGYAGWSEPAPVRALARVRYVAGATTSLVGIEPADMLTNLLASVVPRDNLLPDPELTGSLAALATGAPAIDLRYGNAMDAAAALLGRFSGSSGTV